AKLPELAGVGGHVGMPVAGIDELQACQDDHHDNADLEGHHDAVRAGRLAHAYVTDPTHGRDDEHGGEIDDRAGDCQMPVGHFLEGCVYQGAPEMDVRVPEQIH